MYICPSSINNLRTNLDTHTQQAYKGNTAAATPAERPTDQPTEPLAHRRQCCILLCFPSLLGLLSPLIVLVVVVMYVCTTFVFVFFVAAAEMLCLLNTASEHNDGHKMALIKQSLGASAHTHTPICAHSCYIAITLITPTTTAKVKFWAVVGCSFFSW